MQRSKLVTASTLGLLVAAVCAASLDGCALPGFTLGEQQAQGGAAATTSSSSGRPAQTSSATGGGGSGGGSSSSGCVSVQPPGPPSGVHPDHDTSTHVVAMRSVDLGLAGGVPGYDLDKTCTCIDNGAASCLNPIMQSCDAPGGIDNAFRLLLLQVTQLVPGFIDNPGINANANAGIWSLLIAIDGYDGKPDDVDVDVSFYPSAGYESPDGGVAMPRWDGTDRWNIVASSIDNGQGGGGGAGGGAGGTGGGTGPSDAGAGGYKPRFHSPGAYVKGGVLVAAFPNFELTIAGGGNETITFKLSQGVVSGKLTGTPATGYHLTEGVIAGMWATKDFFAALSSFRDPSGNPVCKSTTGYSILRSEICSFADISTVLGAPSLPCDALSVGIGFTADPANLGDIVPSGTPTMNCAMGDDPADDSCL